MFSLILPTDGNIVDVGVGSIEVISLDDVHNPLKARYSIGHSEWDQIPDKTAFLFTLISSISLPSSSSK